MRVFVTLASIFANLPIHVLFAVKVLAGLRSPDREEVRRLPRRGGILDNPLSEILTNRPEV